MNILIAPNSFKECSSSVEISDLICENLKSMTKYNYIKAPISDGGDGFTEVCDYYFKGKRLTYNISSPYGDSNFDCSVTYSEETKTVYIESANVLGLKIIPKEFRNPLILSSKGLGEIIKHLVEKSFPIKEVVIGIGGTGTIDMGLGACSVHGFKLFDNEKNKMEVKPENYSKAKSVEWNEVTLPFGIKCIVDVDNPLLGKNGAIRVFGGQKGADETVIQILKNGFGNILNLLKNKGLCDSSEFLSGAGGGIPAGFGLFFNSTNISAKDFILIGLGLKSKIEAADLIITGEGSFDLQSLMGKGAGIILNEAAKLEKDIFLVCGKIEEKLKSSLSKNTKYFELQSYFTDETESIKNYKSGIKKACLEITELLK